MLRAGTGLEHHRAGRAPITGVHTNRQALASPHSGPIHRSPIDRGQPRFFFVSARADRGETMNKVLGVALLSVFVISGCAARGVRIAELKDQPTKYATKSVSVTGVVTNSWGIPLVPFQLYSVDDGSGEITVLSRSGRTPSRGTRVEVKGTINEVAVLGGRSVGLHLQEEDRKIKS
jgi:hypothetical protein